MGGAAADAPGADVGADGTIFTPTSVDVVDYDAGNDGAFVPSASQPGAPPRRRRCRAWGAARCTAPPTTRRLAETNAGRPAHEHLRERQLTPLRRVREALHRGPFPATPRRRTTCSATAAPVAEAEAAVKSGRCSWTWLPRRTRCPRGAHLAQARGPRLDGVEPLKGGASGRAATTRLKSENDRTARTRPRSRRAGRQSWRVRARGERVGSVDGSRSRRARPAARCRRAARTTRTWTTTPRTARTTGTARARVRRVGKRKSRISPRGRR